MTEKKEKSSERKIVPVGDRVFVKELMETDHLGFLNISAFQDKKDNLIAGEVLASASKDIKEGEKVYFKKWNATLLKEDKKVGYYLVEIKNIEAKEIGG